MRVWFRSAYVAVSLGFLVWVPHVGWAHQAQQEVSLVVVGDVMLDDTPGKVLAQGRDPMQAFATHFKNADLRVANLECVISTKGQAEPGKPYVFRVHPRALKPLSQHFDAVSLANNHSGDYGPIAFSDMLSRLRKQGIQYFGGGENAKQAHKALILERKGIKIALLSYLDFLPRSFEALPHQPGVAWAEPEQVRFDIQQARQNGADVVIPFMHWGWENERVSNATQQALARLMIDAGADAVIGTHPHVVQDVALYNGKPIVYSLGNFVFDGFTDEANNTGWVLTLHLSKTGVERAAIVEAKINREGIPRPVKSKAPCWKKGASEWGGC